MENLGILGNKVGMTQIFTANGDANAATLINVGPCTVTQLKSLATHGYTAIQIGYKEIKTTALNKPKVGHLKKASIFGLKHLKEYKVQDTFEFKLGQIIDVSLFKEGQFVDITGNSIGKGFSGNQKRHHFSRGPMTHGSKNHRQPGSIGQGSTPGRVFPGKKMAGRLGNTNVTVSNLQILKIYKKQNVILIKGNLPGKAGTLLNIIPTKRIKN
jgi:large subunit ribosomal protein L3